MELATEALTGAAHGERAEGRRVQRNGYRDRDGRHGPGPWNCASRSCARAPISLFWSPAHGGEGAGRRDPGGLRPGRLDTLGGRARARHGGLGREQEPGLASVWRDRRARQAFLAGPIEGEWRISGATHLRQSPRDGRVVSVAVIIAVAVNTDGRREVLGMTVGNSKPRRSGRSFCAPSPAVACAGSSWSSPTRTRASRRPPTACSAPRPSAAGCISCATPWLTRAGPSGASSRPGSAPRSPRPTRQLRAGSGGPWPTSSGRASASSPS